MPYVPGFDYDLFISYAAADNDQGVVEQFIALLEKHIADNVVSAFSKEKVRVYFDRQRLTTQTGVNWEAQLKAAASSSAILVPLLSPNYLSSLYCSKERGWFGTQPHASQGCPYAVTGWVPVGRNPQPKEFEKAQRHPAADSWLALESPEERVKSCREFALKLRDALVEMRASVSAVFLGPAVAGRGADTRSRVMDELEKSGHRVVPGPDFVYEDPEAVRAYLKSSLLAIHFPGDGLDLEGLTAIEESFSSGRKTLLVQPMGSTLSDEEAGLLEEIDAQLATGGRFAGVAYPSSRARQTIRFGKSSAGKYARPGSRRTRASLRWASHARRGILQERRPWLCSSANWASTRGIRHLTPPTVSPRSCKRSASRSRRARP